tara:strand:- start:654 stop:1061 length:408 start_codon:yes stop_codon:yes gene_type:complete
MTNNGRKALTLALAFLLGATSSGLIFSTLSDAETKVIANFFADGSMLINAVEAREHVYVLRLLRDGDTENAIEFLERNLDSKIVGLKESNNHTVRTNEAVLKGVEKAREYRIEHPRNTNIEMIDERVLNALESIE